MYLRARCVALERKEQRKSNAAGWQSAHSRPHRYPTVAVPNSESCRGHEAANLRLENASAAYVADLQVSPTQRRIACRRVCAIGRAGRARLLRWRPAARVAGETLASP